MTERFRLTAAGAAAGWGKGDLRRELAHHRRRARPAARNHDDVRVRMDAAHPRRRWVLVRHEGRERGRAAVDGDAAPAHPFRQPAHRGGGHRGGEEEGHGARRAVEARREAANVGLGSELVGRSHDKANQSPVKGSQWLHDGLSPSLTQNFHLAYGLNPRLALAPARRRGRAPRSRGRTSRGSRVGSGGVFYILRGSRSTSYGR